MPFGVPLLRREAEGKGPVDPADEDKLEWQAQIERPRRNALKVGWNDVFSCPTAEADTSGDGRISVGEGAPASGGILVPLDRRLDEAEGLGELETFPTGNGSYAYEQSITTGNLAVNDDQSFDALTLGNHAIVIHGKTVDGEYEATRPVACGRAAPLALIIS